MEEFELLKAILEELKSINSKISTKTSESLPDAVTVDDIKSYLNIGANAAYEIINRREFTHVNMGRRKCIPKEQFLSWVEREWRKRKIGIA